MKIKDQDKGIVILYGLLLVLGILLFVGIGYVISYDQTTVTTRVNITKALPVVYNITINDGAFINLTEGSTRNVLCNVTILHYQGQADIDKVNASYHRDNETMWGPLNNNSRYLNESCDFSYTYDTNYHVYNCTFDVMYYAYNGTWNCSVQVNSSLNLPNNGSNSSFIYPLYAMNITDILDFGNMNVLDTSSVKTVNVTNWGNQPINLTLYGYGGTTNTTGGNGDLSFVCPAGTNISVGNLRWTLTGDIAWNLMINLTSGPRVIENVTIQKQVDPDVLEENTTFWKLYVPPNPYGYCNGTLVYEATLATA